MNPAGGKTRVTQFNAEMLPQGAPEIKLDLYRMAG
jgi:hypothetical protein